MEGECLFPLWGYCSFNLSGVLHIEKKRMRMLRDGCILILR